MKRFVLDTDTLSLLQHGHQGVVENVSRRHPGAVAITIITVEEQLAGWFALLRRATGVQALVPVYDRMCATVRFLSTLPLLSFTEASADVYERLREQKPRAGRMDLRIAAIAMAHDATLVTRNARDFKGIEGLAVEDWTSG